MRANKRIGPKSGTSLIERDSLCMRTPSRLGPAPSKDMTTLLRGSDNHATDRRIGPNIAQPSLRQPQRRRHKVAIANHQDTGPGERRSRSIVFDGLAVLGKSFIANEVFKVADLSEVLVDRCKSHIGDGVQVHQRIHHSLTDGIR